MAILVDTNILLRSVQPHHPQDALVEHAFAFFHAQGEVPFVSVQNLIEFWVAATRPQVLKNGLGMTTDAAASELAAIKDLFTILPEPASIFQEWEQLVISYKVAGKIAHDARLVAVMRLCGITKILTFNVSDFTRFTGIEAISPISLS